MYYCFIIEFYKCAGYQGQGRLTSWTTLKILIAFLWDNKPPKINNNIIFIKDILDEENTFKTYDELKNQFNWNLTSWSTLI